MKAHHYSPCSLSRVTTINVDPSESSQAIQICTFCIFTKMRMILYIFCICPCVMFLSVWFLLNGSVIWCWLTVMPCPPIDYPNGSLLKMLQDWTSSCASLFEEQLPRLGIADGYHHIAFQNGWFSSHDSVRKCHFPHPSQNWMPVF